VKTVNNSNVDIPKTPEEIEACKQKVVESVASSRSYSMKDMFISS
jgi:hypothetical protein